MTLGQRIQELRKQAGLSQEALGEALGVSRQAVSKWEGDNGIPELDTLIAMSKLFGITVGQLLGVETPEEKADEAIPEAPAGFTEEQVEEILRRYVEESRRQESANQNTVGRYPIGSWIIAACAVVLSIVVAIVAIGKVREVKERINTLWTNVMDVEEIVTNVRNQVGGLSDELRGVLEEQGSLLSTFACEVVGFDVENQTVDVRLTTTLKEYTDGSKVQFILKWIKTDQTKGELVCDPVEGPSFVIEVTIPMNYHLDIGVRVLQTDGTILEQQLKPIYGGMHPDSFTVQMRSAGAGRVGREGDITSIRYDVELYSEWPELIYPVQAFVMVYENGKEVMRKEATLTDCGDGIYKFVSDFDFDEPIDEDSIGFRYLVIDSYGRESEVKLW